MIYAYIRVSSDKQITDNQRYELECYSAAKGVQIDNWVEETISSKKALKKRALWEVLTALKSGDTLLVTELSRIGRNLYEVMTVLGELMQRGVVVYATKQQWTLGDNLISKVQAFGFTLAADLERTMISQRTKDGLARALAAGKTLGHPCKPNSYTKLSHKREEIAAMVAQGMSITDISYAVCAHRLTVAAEIRRMNGEQVEFKTVRKAVPQADAVVITPATPTAHSTQKSVDELMNAGGRMFAYIRVSSDKQTNENQRLQISRLAEAKGWTIAEWSEETISSRVQLEKRDVYGFLQKLQRGDVLIVSEMSRIGRSMADLIRVFEMLIGRGVSIHSIRDGYTFGDNSASRTIIGCLSIAASIERDLISQRTTEAVRYRRACGVTLGRPKGRKDSEARALKNEAEMVADKDKILVLLQNHKSAKDIGKKYGVAASVVSNFVLKHFGKSIQELREEHCTILTPQNSKHFRRAWHFRKKIAQMAMEGETWKGIADELNISYHTITRYGEQLVGSVEGEDWKARKAATRKPKQPQIWQNVERVRGMLELASVVTVSQHIGVPERTLRNFMKRAGIPAPTK